MPTGNNIYMKKHMKTLVIHPEDHTTDFLKPIYASLPDTTVVMGGVGRKEIHALIEGHERILMMGHGSSTGLFSMGRYGVRYFEKIVDHESVPYLRGKENIFIWCYASDFVKTHDLKGFSTGMFISEVSEARICNVSQYDQQMVDESNACFVDVVARHIEEPLPVLYDMTRREYSAHAKGNLISLYNTERLFCAA